MINEAPVLPPFTQSDLAPVVAGPDAPAIVIPVAALPPGAVVTIRIEVPAPAPAPAPVEQRRYIGGGPRP